MKRLRKKKSRIFKSVHFEINGTDYHLLYETKLGHISEFKILKSTGINSVEKIDLKVIEASTLKKWLPFRLFYFKMRMKFRLKKVIYKFLNKYW